MPKKKKYVIIGIILVILVVIVLLLVKSSQPKYEYSTEEKEQIKEEVLTKADSLASENVTLKDVQNILNDENALNVLVTVGEQSYLRNKPSDELIEKYSLQSLVSQQEHYVSKVEERYLKNLQYKVVSETIEGNELCENIEIITYYYSLYLNDYINIISNLLTFDLENIEKNEKNKVEYYKLQLKALKVLDNHLDDYENVNQEKEELQICYENGELKDESQLLTLTIALQGELYSNMNMSDPDVMKQTSERLNNYLKEIENSFSNS